MSAPTDDQMTEVHSPENSSQPEPDVELLHGSDGSWRLGTRDLGRLRAALGSDLLLALCRCFVHENRLLSFAHYRSLLREHAMAKPASLERSKVAILWFEVGTIRELGRAIGDLRTVLNERGWLDAPGLGTLNDVERRWQRLSELRNKAAFHVDREVLAQGLSQLPDGPTVLVAGDGAPHDEGWLLLGDVVLMEGMHESKAECDEVVDTVVKDREAVLLALIQVFTHVVRRAGLSYGDAGTPARATTATLHPLDGAVARARRAEKHLQEVRSAIEAFGREQTECVRIDQDSIIFEHAAVLPLHLALPVSDCIHNLRSALDFIVYELAFADSGTKHDYTQWPVADTKEAFDRRVPSDLRGLVAAHVDAIEAYQPYKGVAWTRTLREISNPDKHRHLSMLDGDFKVQATANVGKPGSFGDRRDGRIFRGIGKDGLDVHVAGTYEIIIRFADGQPVVETLESISREVRAVIEAFAPQLKTFEVTVKRVTDGGGSPRRPCEGPGDAGPAPIPTGG